MSCEIHQLAVFIVGAVISETASHTAGDLMLKRGFVLIHPSTADRTDTVLPKPHLCRASFVLAFARSVLLAYLSFVWVGLYALRFWREVSF
jgi:hypothetical protein